MLTKQQQDHFKSILAKELKACEQDINELKGLTKPVSLDASIGRISRMDAINNKAINDKQLRDKQVQKQKLERALQRVDKEEFGKCSKCGNDIAMGRLKYMPYTTKCVKCA